MHGIAKTFCATSQKKISLQAQEISVWSEPISWEMIQEV